MLCVWPKKKKVREKKIYANLVAILIEMKREKWEKDCLLCYSNNIILVFCQRSICFSSHCSTPLIHLSRLDSFVWIKWCDRVLLMSKRNRRDSQQKFAFNNDESIVWSISRVFSWDNTNGSHRILRKWHWGEINSNNKRCFNDIDDGNTAEPIFTRLYAIEIHESIFQIVYSTKRCLRKLLELFVLQHKITLRYNNK